MDDFVERRILTGLVTSTEYLEAIARRFKPALIASDTCRALCGWCLDYYNRYGRAPGRDIEAIFIDKQRELSKGDVRDIQEVLHDLSKEYEATDGVNVRFLTDETLEHFRRRSAHTLASSVLSLLEGGTEELSQAEQLMVNFAPAASISSMFVDPFGGLDGIKLAFKSREKPLVEFGKALGLFWDDQFVRDSFIALLAPEKRGKSWILLDIALKAHAHDANVALIQAGDMSEQQQLIRIYTRISGRPFPSHRDRRADDDEDEFDRGSGPPTVWVPVEDCILNQTSECVRPEREQNGKAMFSSAERKGMVEEGTLGAELRDRATEDWSPCLNCKARERTVWLKKKKVYPMDVRSAYRAMQKWQERHKASFRLSTHTVGSLTVSGIRALLDAWRREEKFVPDVIVIDYADLLRPDADAPRGDYRHGINQVWERLRALSQERNCLVVTATQAAATSYNRKGVMQPMDFSEDKRKYAHVTAMYGLNQTSDEKRMGVMRINQMVVREGEFHSDNVVHVLQSLALGRPLLGSY